MPKGRPKKVTDEYNASVKIFGKVYTSTGSSVSDAISKLIPGNAKGKGILTITHGNKSKERILMPMITQRLFNSRGLTKEIALKQMSSLFSL